MTALRENGQLLADAAQRAGLGAPVPPCQPWLVKDLLRHTGYVHRWAAQHITERPANILDGPAEPEILQRGAPDEELLAWFRDGHATLVEALESADPDVQTAVFMADTPSPLAFWTRRQAHETAIHRVDAESADGTAVTFPAAFAADGIDELIMGFGRRRKYQPSAAAEGTLCVSATDTGHAWHAEGRDGRVHPRRAGDGGTVAECTVAGPASGLYQFLWNRATAAEAGVTITGDPALLARWQSAVRVRWD